FLVNLAGVKLISLGADGKAGTGDDTSVVLSSVQVRANRQIVVTPLVPLPRGKYQLTIDPSVVADLSGNHIAAPFQLTFTSEDVAATTFWNSDTDGAWNNPANWSTGQVPGPNDVVLIDRIGAAPTITIPAGNFTVKSLDSRHPLIISGGTLSVTNGASRAEASFTLSNGGALVVNGAGTSFSATGTTSVNAGSLFTQNGGVINLPTVTTLTGNTFSTSISAN